MDTPKFRSALIVGTGPGLSASLARLFARNGLAVAVAARQTDKLAALAKETGASVHACNAADPADVAALFKAVDGRGGAPDVVVYNASSRVRAPLIDVAPEEARRSARLVRQPARSRRHRRNLLGHAPAAPQRVELGDRGAAVDGEVLGRRAQASVHRASRTLAAIEESRVSRLK